MTRRLLASYVLLAGFILVLIELPLGLSYAGRAEDKLLADVERDARVLSILVEEQAGTGDAAAVRSLALDYARRTDGRVVVTDDRGISVFDTTDPEGSPRDFSSRPEFVDALEGTTSEGLRLSNTLGRELAYVAVPIVSESGVSGALRISFPTEGLRAEVRENWLRLAGLSVMVLLTAGAVGWFVARWATAPVAELDEGARRLAAGDLDSRTAVRRGPPELRDLSATFNTMAARIEVLVDSQRAFVADASHQLRTPLTALRLRLESLEGRAGEDPETRRDLTAATSEVDRLAQLVDALLAIARAESHTAITPTDVAAAATEAVLRWEPLAAEHGVTLTCRAPEAVWAGFVEGGVAQVLDNLLDNAIDASGPGSATEVHVADHDGHRVVLRVRDHGTGLDEAARARATTRFWRGPHAVEGGTGLGLAICAELTRMSGGTLRLQDPADGEGGLEVVVTLDPARTPDPDAAGSDGSDRLTEARGTSDTG